MWMAVLKILISTGKRVPTFTQNDLFFHINCYQISPTVSAAVRLMPKPPALVLNRNTKISFLWRKEIKPPYFVHEQGITTEAIFWPTWRNQSYFYYLNTSEHFVLFIHSQGKKIYERVKEVNLQVRTVWTRKHSICNSSLLICIKTNQGLFILPTLEIKISYGQRTIYCFTELTPC